MNRSALSVATLLTVCSLLLAACTAPPAGGAPQATSAPAATTPAPAAPVTIKVMVVDYVQDVTDKWLQNEVVPAFQKEHPNIKVEFIYVTWDTLDTTIAGYFAAQDGADILNLGSEYVAEYGDRMAPLNQYLGEQAWPDIKQFLPGALDTVRWQGELRGLPWLSAPRANLCRADLLKQSGINQSPATFADAVNVAKTTTQIKDGKLMRAGYDSLISWHEYLALIYSLGGKLYKDNGAPTFDSPEARAALKFMYDRRRAVLPNETTTDLPQAQGSRLADGTAVCLFGNLGAGPKSDDPLWKDIQISPEVTDQAAFPNAKPVVLVFNDWLAVPKYSKHVPEAAEFLKFLGSAQNLNTYNKAFNFFPPRTDAWTGYVADNPAMVQMGALTKQYSVGFADVRQTAKFRDILVKEMTAYFTDQEDLDTALHNIQDQYTQVLKDAGRIK